MTIDEQAPRRNMTCASCVAARPACFHVLFEAQEVAAAGLPFIGNALRQVGEIRNIPRHPFDPIGLADRRTTTNTAILCDALCSSYLDQFR